MTQQQLLYRRSERKHAKMQPSQNRQAIQTGHTNRPYKQAIQTGLNEAGKELSPHTAKEIKHGLHVVYGVIYRGKRLIVPQSL